MRRAIALVVPFLCMLLIAPTIGAQDATPMAGNAPAASLLAGLGYPDLVVTSDGTTNDLPAMAKKIGKRIHFVHLRNTKRDEHGNFYEADHLDGDTDMYAVMKEILAIAKDQFYVIGISASPPGYGIVKNNFHNVPESMIGSWQYPDPAPTNPEQFWIE